MDDEVLKNWAEALTRRARKAKQDQCKLRKEYLDQKAREPVSIMAPEEQ